MAKNFRRIEDIMNNSADRSKLTNSIDEAVRLKQQIKDRNDDMKVIVDDIHEKVEIDPKIFKALVNISFKNNAAEKQRDLNSLETAIECLFTINDDNADHDA